MSEKDSPSFEARVEALENIIERMEGDELSLEEAMQAFEKGIKLTREAQQTLADAEQQVRQLIEENGQLRETPFEDGQSE